MSDTPPDPGSGQDQLVIRLDLRREDPVNPDGSAASDLEALVTGPTPGAAAALAQLCGVYGFDPDLSLISIEKVVDYEGPATGSVTISQLAELEGGGGTPSTPESGDVAAPESTDTGNEPSTEGGGTPAAPESEKLPDDSKDESPAPPV